jgi:plasmid stability protein
MEAEVREILTAAVTEPQEDVGLARALLDRFGSAGGADLDLPARSELPRAAAVDLGS